MTNPDGVRLLALADDELAGWARSWHWNDCASDQPVDPSIYFRDMRMLKAFIEHCRRAAPARCDALEPLPTDRYAVDDPWCRPAAPSRLDAGSVDRVILQELTRQSEIGVKYLAGLNVDDLVKAVLSIFATPPALPAGEEVRQATIEECAIYLEKIGARYHYGKDLPAHLRALSPSSNGKPATENENDSI